MKTLFFFLGVVYIAVTGSSCTAYKAARQSKKDNKTFAAAISNERVSQRLDAYYNALHPLQKPILIKGKDSIIEVPVIVDRVHDSIIQAECPALDLKTLVRTVIKVRVDTLKIPDSSCERRAQIVQTNLSNLQGKYEQQTLQVNEVKADKKKTTWWLIGVSVFSVLAIGGLTYLLFKK